MYLDGDGIYHPAIGEGDQDFTKTLRYLAVVFAIACFPVLVKLTGDFCELDKRRRNIWTTILLLILNLALSIASSHPEWKYNSRVCLVLWWFSFFIWSVTVFRQDYRRKKNLSVEHFWNVLTSVVALLLDTLGFVLLVVDYRGHKNQNKGLFIACCVGGAAAWVWGFIGIAADIEEWGIVGRFRAWWRSRKQRHTGVGVRVRVGVRDTEAGEVAEDDGQGHTGIAMERPMVTISEDEYFQLWDYTVKRAVLVEQQRERERSIMPMDSALESIQAGIKCTQTMIDLTKAYA